MYPFKKFEKVPAAQIVYVVYDKYCKNKYKYQVGRLKSFALGNLKNLTIKYLNFKLKKLLYFPMGQRNRIG